MERVFKAYLNTTQYDFWSGSHFAVELKDAIEAANALSMTLEQEVLTNVTARLLGKESMRPMCGHESCKGYLSPKTVAGNDISPYVEANGHFVWNLHCSRHTGHRYRLTATSWVLNRESR